MFKQLNAGVVSLGLISTMTAPVLAQDAFNTSTETNSVPTNSLLVEDYSNLYSSVPKIEESNTLTIKNTLDFSDISAGEEDLVTLENFDLLSQRRTRSTSKYKYTAGFDFVTFGWVRDTNGSITSTIGFNVFGLGFAYKKYFQPTRDGKFNFHFTIATYLLIIPTVAVGVDYQWEEGWYAGGGVGVFPYFFGDTFFVFPYPYVQGGYRWQ